MQARKIRLLRKKYRITLAELAAVCGFSEQRISEKVSRRFLPLQQQKSSQDLKN